MNIVYIVFGTSLANYSQCYFSIMSLLAQTNRIERIIIATDHLHYFKGLSLKNIEILALSTQELEDWRGEYNYVFRIKIKALQKVVTNYKNQSLLYLDADTYFLNDVEVIENDLKNDISYMHLKEDLMVKSSRNTQKKMWKAIKNETYGGYYIDKSLRMWNAGVIGLSSSKAEKLLEKVLLVNDQMIKENIPERLIEQLSFSLVLEKEGMLKEANNYIAHYWGNKEKWNEFISNFLLESYFLNNDIVATVKKLKELKKQPKLVKTKVSTLLRFFKK